jgi:hypothetical protein
MPRRESSSHRQDFCSSSRQPDISPSSRRQKQQHQAQQSPAGYPQQRPEAEFPQQPPQQAAATPTPPVFYVVVHKKYSTTQNLENIQQYIATNVLYNFWQ